VISPERSAYGALAVLLAVVAMIPSLRSAGWSVTALPRVGAGTAMADAARRVDPSFRLVDQGSYDGQFYWGIAVDPVARGNVHQAFDTASYRYGHPLLGWLGWLLSAGQAPAAAAALVVVGLLALFVALNPGLLYSAAHDLAEPLCLALLLLALIGFVRERRTLLLVSLVLLPLAKEQLVLVPLVLAVWRRRDAPRILATILPAVGWWIYARLTLGAWFTSGDNALGVPFVGWARALARAGVNSYNADPGTNQLGEATIVVLVALLALLALAAIRALRLRAAVDPIYLALAAVAACLGPIATALERDALRNTAILLALVPLVGNTRLRG
jgi:hypothetical protein